MRVQPADADRDRLSGPYPNSRDDSVKSVHGQRLAVLDTRWRDDPHVPHDLIGRIYWYAWFARTDDTTTRAHWRARLLRERRRRRSPSRSGFATQ